MPKPTLISGIQPTGKLHLGNYLGALRNFVALQDSGEYDCYFFIADLHALTENPKAKDLSANIVNLAADFLAAGLDPKKSTIFQQSRIQSIQELKWILSTLTPISELIRMTAFKEKVLQPLKLSEKVTKEKLNEIVEKSNFGLAEYPILMAADILLFDAKLVPVGEDQLQHLEFTRAIARKFNSHFGKTFIEPQPLLTATPRVMSLDDPTKKMSKSRPAGCVFLNDSPKTIQAKMIQAVTDSGREIKYDIKNKPAISNLLIVYSALTGNPIKNIEEKYAGRGYADFKKELAKLVSDSLSLFRKIKIPSAEIKSILKSGSEKAQKKAQPKIQEIKKKIGLDF